MKIEPNSDIGMEAEVILCHKGKIDFINGDSMNSAELISENNVFEKLCKDIDPNTTYIDVLMPDRDDSEIFFLLKEKGEKYEIHVQNVLLREDEIWSRWKNYKKVNS